MAHEEMITEAQADRMVEWAINHGHTREEALDQLAYTMNVKEHEEKKKESPGTPHK